MRASGFGSLAALAVVAVATLGLAGCANEPTRVQPGATAADTLQRLGAPTGRYPLTGGGERLQYSRMPAGFEVTDIDVDASGTKDPFSGKYYIMGLTHHYVASGKDGFQTTIRFARDAHDA